MRWLLLACFGLTFACTAEPVDGNQASMDIALDSTMALPVSEEPSPADPPPGLPPDATTEQTIQTLDCASGGTVRVTIRREISEDPYKRQGYLQWQYTDCNTWPFGTINGNATYSRSIEGGPPWKRELRYFADLSYSGEEDGDCDAYVTLTQIWDSAEHTLEIPSTCPHPVREWWDRLGVGPG